jgi:hypothetical protein
LSCSDRLQGRELAAVPAGLEAMGRDNQFCIFDFILQIPDNLPNTSIQENSSIPLVIKTLLIAYILPENQLSKIPK